MRARGFTLIELLVVLAIVSALLAIVAPLYLRQADRAKEVALKENLAAMRLALDQFYADRGGYPERLDELVAHRYLRALPLDPITGRRDSWVPLLRGEEGGRQVVHDLRSGAAGNAMDGTPFRSW